MTFTFGRRVAALSLTVLATASVLAGCGGDNDDSAEPSDSATTASETVESEAADEGVTDEEFVAEANGVCEAVYPDVNAAASYVDPEDPTTVTDYFLPTVQELQDELNAVTPSEGLAEDFAYAMDLQQQQLDAIIEDPSALFAMDGVDVNGAFDSIGLTSCGSGSADIAPSE